jgi:hypothetical protein
MKLRSRCMEKEHLRGLNLILALDLVSGHNTKMDKTGKRAFEK